MRVLEQLQAILDQAGVPCEASPGSLAVKPDSGAGFEVRIVAGGGDHVVAYGSVWHEQFEAPEDALCCFLFGLTDQCQLRSVFYGTTECSGTLQRLVDGEWADCSSTGLVLVPFWRRRSVRVRSNASLSLAQWRELRARHAPGTAAGSAGS